MAPRLIASPSRRARRLGAAAVVAAALAGAALAADAAERRGDRPNILWLTSEDHGPEMGCYGDPLARTPNVDALAARGLRYRRVWSVAPVCAPARTAIITGLYPSSTGAIHMRSMVPLPPDRPLFPEFLRQAGYYCTNRVKQDYNVPAPADLWDESSAAAHWRNRAPGQPFFAVFNSTQSHESQVRRRPHTLITDPQRVRVPAYHPDTPAVRADWAQYYDQVSAADAEAGERLRELEEAGLADDTIVFYYADHGSGLPRSKRWPANSGLHVPLVVYFPEKWRHLAPSDYAAGAVSDRLVSFVDLAPTVLSLAGIAPPAWMQGRALAGPYQVPGPDLLYGQRGRMDERQDLVRSVTDGRYVYLRNFHPHVAQGQHIRYQFETPTTRIWREHFDLGRASPAQAVFWRVPKNSEELYDLECDRDEVANLAASPSHRAVLERLRDGLRRHLLAVRDVGFLPESEMLARSRGATPSDLGRDESRYPLVEILATAELAAGFDSASIPRLAEALAHRDPAVRYWAALGLRIRGEPAVRAHREGLERALADDSAEVRIVAAEALGLFAGQPGRRLALPVLRALISPAGNGTLVALPALAAVEALGDGARDLHADVARVDAAAGLPHRRYGGYVERLVERITPPSPAGSARTLPQDTVNAGRPD